MPVTNPKGPGAGSPLSPRSNGRSSAERFERDHLAERRDAGYLLTENQEVHVFRSFVGLNTFQIAQVPEALVLVKNSHASKDVSRKARDFYCRRDIVPLRHGDLGGRDFPGILQLAQTQRHKLSLRQLA